MQRNDHLTPRRSGNPAGSWERYRGCLLGGAVGDALGAAVEFDSWHQIRERFGRAGLQQYAPAYGRTGAVTDDTQMTLFTAEGLIRARARLLDRGVVDVDAVLHRAYERWLFTQVGDAHRVPWDPEFGDGSTSGWLVAQPFLHHRRAPGTTCLAALEGRHRIATPAEPINGSKGCGGVMRAAPAALTGGDAFDLGCRAAALTHGHPSGWLAAGALADMIDGLLHAALLDEAVNRAVDRCRSHPAGGEVAAALRAAVDLAAQPGPPTVERVESLGAGWVAEEALAIAVYCALTATGFRDGVLVAVNHSGDSDSTGAVCGNLLGTAFGISAVDEDLLDGLEGRDTIGQLADDLHATFREGIAPAPDRYPSW